MRKQMRFIVFALLVLTLNNTTYAADVYVEKRHQIHIDGDIREGDAERLASLLSGARIVTSVNVKSMGGNVQEAIKIASLIQGVQADVRIKPGELCASACFFIFIAGTYREASFFTGEQGTLPSEEMRRKGYHYVGIHRPYLSSQDETTASSIDKQRQIMRGVDAYLKQRAVPQYLIDEMMSRPSNDIYWLRKKDIEAIGQYEAGYEEVLIKQCGYSRNNAEWSDERLDQFLNCEFDTRERELFPIQRKFIEKLRTGWRPWGKR